MATLHLDHHSIAQIVNKFGIGKTEVRQGYMVIDMPKQNLSVGIKNLSAAMEVEAQGIKVQVSTLSITPEGVQLNFRLAGP